MKNNKLYYFLSFALAVSTMFGCKKTDYTRTEKNYGKEVEQYCKCPLFRTGLDSTFQFYDPCKEFKQTSTPSPHPRACQWQGFHVLNKNYSSRLVI